MANSPVKAPARLFEFFAAEAVEYADSLRELMWLPASERDTAQMLAAARGLRGVATMVRLGDLAVVAGRMERIARALHTRRLQWSEPLSYSLQAVLYELPELITAASIWGPGESERAAAIADALHGFAPVDDRKNSAMVVPIARFFHDDGGPHVIYVAVTPQTQFEQQLREPAPERADRSSARSGPTQPDARLAEPRTPPPSTPTSSPRPESRQPTPAHPRPVPFGDRATPRGQDLHSLISQGLAGFAGMELESPPAQLAEDGGVVPIQTLLYAGRAAITRAREIRAAQTAAAREPTPEELDELMDLMELATSA